MNDRDNGDNPNEAGILEPASEPTETEQLLAELLHNANVLHGKLIIDHNCGDFGNALEERVEMARRVRSDVALLAPILATMRRELATQAASLAALRVTSSRIYDELIKIANAIDRSRP